MRAGPTLSALAVILATVGCAPPRPKADIDQTVPLRRTIAVGAPVNASISYLINGDPGGTRMVLVHGTPGSAEGWRDYVLNPPPGVEVVALDRPGFGQSGPEGAVTSLATQAAAVVALLPTDGRRAVLVGHSLGGPIVTWVAAEHPDRIASVVLLAASVDPALEKINPMQYVAQWWPVKSMLSRSLRNANEELMVLKAELTRLKDLMPKLTAPVIIVQGTEDSLVPPANVPYLQAHLVHARCSKLVMMDQQNHFLPWNAEPVVRNAMAWALAPPC